MKKIVPFNNILTFNTDVKEITAISLEHKIENTNDSVSGVFYISGEYKIIEGQLEKEKFNFELPFDIALGSNYKQDTLVIDIDDFRYELIENNKLKVNIDLYIDGEIDEEKHEELKKIEKNNESEPILTKIQERLDILDEMISNIQKEEPTEEVKEETNIDIDNTNINNNEVFNSFNEEEKFVTYRVYTTNETDTLDKIMEKYHITKEELSKYNSLEDIHPGTKIIIPNIENNNDK